MNQRGHYESSRRRTTGPISSVAPAPSLPRGPIRGIDPREKARNGALADK
jgi:hypothetical protein